MSDEKCDGMKECAKEQAIRAAQEAAFREHQWAHKTLADGAVIRNRQDLGSLLGDAQGRARTFTREEVLTVLRAALATHGTNPAHEIRHLITVFERME